MGNKKNITRKKRKFCGNRYTTVTEAEPAGQPEQPDQPQPRPGPSKSCASAKKIKKNVQGMPDEYDTSSPEHLTGFIFITIEILTLLINQFLCPECSSKGFTITHGNDIKRGLAQQFDVHCKSCSYMYTFYNSGRVGSAGVYEVNMRIVTAFCNISKGFEALKSFCGIMNIPNPMSSRSWCNLVTKLSSVFSNQAVESMKQAGSEVQKCGEHCAISVDGTWQRRGRSSLNGVVTILSIITGKVLDVCVMTKKCKSCEIWDKKDKNSIKYQQWAANHKCPINHKGSSGSMEPAGAKEMFHRSQALHGLKYTEYIGDGDTSSYKYVKDSKPYGDIEIHKKECVGHVQKRCGTRLRTLRIEYKGKKLSDGKSIQGRKGRLTDSAINRLQNYYGIAIRKNKGERDEMKRAIKAVLYHCASTDENPQHQYCSPTWCEALSSNNYKHKKGGLDPAVLEVVKPIFEALADDNLLDRCLDGFTQNPNESLNGVIWQRANKTVFASRQTVELATNWAVCSFNDGGISILKVLSSLNISPGRHTTKFIMELDEKRLTMANRASLTPVKKRRKQLRAIKKGFADKNTETEGVTYLAGAF